MGRRPNNLILGAGLTTAAFFCVSLVGALAKVSGQYTSTGVLLLFQNAIGLLDVGSLAALAGALFLAIAMMSVRWLGATEPMTRVLLYYFLLSTVLAIPIAVADWRPIPNALWPWLVALGFAQLASQVLIVAAYRYAAEKVGPFIYSVIVFTALIDWIVWNHRPTLLACLGMALVIGGGLVAVRARRTTTVPPVGTS